MSETPRNGTYLLEFPLLDRQMFVGIERKQPRSDGHVKDGTPIILVEQKKAARIEVQKLSGDNFRMTFVSQEASGMEVGCDQHNLQQNNKVFVTKDQITWAIDRGSHPEQHTVHIQVANSGMYMTVPDNAREGTQLKLEQLAGKKGQELKLVPIHRRED